jgi:hypothetical protein
LPSLENCGAAVSATTMPAGMPAVPADAISTAGESPAFQ